MSKSTLWLAIGGMALGMIFIPMGDGIAKHLQSISDYQPAMLSWSRFAIGACLILPWVLATKKLPPLTQEQKPFWIRQCVRGVLIAATVTLIVTAVGLSPIADVFGAFFIGPGISVILAHYLLGVRAKRTDWIAVVAGFIGVLMVVQPTGVISPGIPFALASGCCYGAFLVATRWAAGSGAPIAQLAAQLTIATVVLLPLGLPGFFETGFVWPGWIIASAFFSGAANLLSILALSKLGNAVLAPVIYLQVVAASVIGFLAFGDIPNRLSAIGLLLIVATGAFQAIIHHLAHDNTQRT